MKCKNKWFESDGFCCMCGGYHESFVPVKSKPKLPTTEVRVEPIVISTATVHYLDDDRMYLGGDYRDAFAYIRRLLGLLEKKFGFKADKVYYRGNTKRSMFSYSYNPKTLEITSNHLTFGWGYMARKIVEGNKEYKTLQYIIGHRSLKGYASIHHTVLHEYAHLMQRKIYGHAPRHHGSEFVESLKKCMRAFPNLLN